MMLSKVSRRALPVWLGRELEAWQRDALITEDQRRTILARYTSPPTSTEIVSRALVWLAVLSAGIGVVVLLVWNWAAIPARVKIAAATGGAAAAYAAAVALAHRGRLADAERTALVAALISGAALYVGLEATRVDPETTDVMLLWSIVLASTAVLVPSGLIGCVATAALLWWMAQTGGWRPAPWGFLLVWPLVAITAERTGHRSVGGCATIAFGCWTFFTALAVWGGRGADTPAFVVALLSGVWLDAQARAPAERRSRWARATPALVMIALPLGFLLPVEAHRGLADWRTESPSLWPLLALVATLAASTVRLSVRRRPWRWPALVVVTVCVAWIGAWLLQPLPHADRAVTRWTWTVIFSGAAIVVGSSAIREFPTTRDRGSFIVGILVILATLLVRSMDTAAGGVALQAALLLVVAGVLYWLARTVRHMPEARG